MAAVAANFLPTVEALEPLFESATGDDLVIAAGSTGSLYAQIANGAPYDVFLAGDEERPARIVEAGLAIAGSAFTYAVGTLVLYSADPALVAGPEALQSDFHHLAIANPRTAPYGAAALEVLQSLGLTERLRGRIAHTQSVSGAYSAVVSGAAELGFVALSSVLAGASVAPGSHWEPPAELYRPLRQSAVLLRRAGDKPAAAAFMVFLRSPAAREIIAQHGYGIE